MTERSPALHLVLLAGGQGTRAPGRDGDPPKQFRRAAGRMLLSWSARELAAAPHVASLVVALGEPWRTPVEAELAELDLPCPWRLADAGPTRTASTWSALQVLVGWRRPDRDDLVAVHDTARPFATRALLARLAAIAAAAGAAVPGTPVTDTIVEVRQGVGGNPRAGYLEREALRALQTPQVFRWQPLHDAHRWCDARGLCFTDDGGLLAVRGLRPVVAEGEPDNWKVTTDADFARAGAILEARGA